MSRLKYRVVKKGAPATVPFERWLQNWLNKEMPKGYRLVTYKRTKAPSNDSHVTFTLVRED